jgi:Tfp pilus assembly protein PilF
VRGFDFAGYDDTVYVTANPHLRHGLSREGLRFALAPYETNWIPLTWLSLLADYELSGMDPRGYHRTNLVLHAASTALLFLALSAMSGSPGRSAWVAAVFAWHPLHVESVAWVAERKDVLAGLFWMLTLCAWAAYARRPGWLRWSAAGAALGAGLLAKGVGITLPFVLLLLDFWPLRRLEGTDGRLEGRRVARAVAEKLPMLALAAAIAVVTYVVQRDRGATWSLEEIPLAVRAQNALVSYVAYLGDAVWPSGLAVFYPHPMAPLPVWQWAGAGLLLASATAVALVASRRRPWILVGWLWYVGTLVPMIGLVQVGLQARADRYTYLPLIGISIAVAWEVHARVVSSRRLRIAATVAAGAALLALALAARAQLAHWRDAEAVFARARSVTRDNFVAENAIGQLRLRDGDLDAAVEHLAEAVRLRPRWAAPRAGLADALAERGRLDEASWNYAEALRWRPADAGLRLRYGGLLLRRGWHDEALAQAAEAIRLWEGDPAQAGALAFAASVWSAKGDPRAAAALYERALAIDPGMAVARANLGLARLAAGDAEGALASLRAAQAAGGNEAELHMGIAQALARLGREREAAAEYRAALAARPGWIEASNNLAWLLASAADPSLRDPAEAVRLAQAAATASGRSDAAVLDTLATAQAASGRFEEAVTTLDAALALSEARGDAARSAALRERRARFAAREPLAAGRP